MAEVSAEPSNLLAQFFKAGKVKENAFSLCLGIKDGFVAMDEGLNDLRLPTKDPVLFKNEGVFSGYYRINFDSA